MTDKPTFTEINSHGEIFEADTPGRAKALRIAAARRQLAEDAAANPGKVQALNVRLTRMDAAKKRERQRVDHLVLGLPRPVKTVIIGKRGGRKKPKTAEVPVTLEPGIEEAMQIREAWAHKRYGTPETWDQSTRTHSGALAQLHLNGTIDKEQLEWAAEIANVYRSIEADVGVKVASLEARVDHSRGGGRAAEGVKRVRMHLAYGYWRQQLPSPKQLALDMIVGDAVGYSVAAARHHVHNRRAKRVLIEALDRWPQCVAHAFSVADRDTIDALNHGLRVDPTWLIGPAPAQAIPFDDALSRASAVLREAYPVPPAAPLPPIDPMFLDERGRLKEWTDIAAIIRGQIEEQA